MQRKAPLHNTIIVKRFFITRKVAIIHQPPYSPYLAPPEKLYVPSDSNLPRKFGIFTP